MNTKGKRITMWMRIFKKFKIYTEMKNKRSWKRKKIKIK